jgi:hypothetical protein
VIESEHPILLVVHDGDGDWQFLCGTTSNAEDGRVICLDEALAMDPTLLCLSDLPLGWCAWRESITQDWQRSKKIA